MSILSRPEIKKRLNTFSDANRLVVTPLLEEAQIGSAALDVRLGTEFILIRHTNLRAIDPKDADKIRENIGQYQEAVHIDYGEALVFHPGQFILGATLEYISLPIDLAAQVVGRSTWARLGLIIEAAPRIAPGFKGTITLELMNNGLTSIALYPGSLIAQLIFEQCLPGASYDGRYKYSTGPVFSKIYNDDDLNRVVNLNSKCAGKT